MKPLYGNIDDAQYIKELEARCCMGVEKVDRLTAALGLATADRDMLRNTVSLQDDLLNMHSDRIQRGVERTEQLEAALKDAIKAVESLSDDDLGYGQAADGHGDVYHWPLRDELLTNLRGVIQSAGDNNNE